ncbi:MAG: hypothetical protein DMF62_00155 [Acidobacteria bacterium]|nr:MAG: hypothetical protein DMF62_00155 [Acidobacteriota bacterium]
MAFLYDVSLNPESGTLPGIADDMNSLHKELTAILTKISGHPFVTSEGSLFMQVPKALKKCAKDLKSNYAKVWDDTIIFYEPKAYGASSNKADSYVWFGEFFLKPQPRLVLEKVLWHEYLHLVVNLPKEMHHGKINDIIKHCIGLPGDPNPLGTVGLEC